MTSIDIALFIALISFGILLYRNAAMIWLLVVALAATTCGTFSILQGRWEAVPALSLVPIFLLLAWVTPRIGWTGRNMAVILFALVLACESPFWFFPVFTLPQPGGPFTVGEIAAELVDPTRTGIAGEPTDRPRRLPIRIWYPAPPDARGPRAPYTGHVEAWSLGSNFGERWFYYAQLASVRTRAMLSVPPAPGHWPVVLFNHGFWSYPEQNSALAERLASHGYIVVSIAHPGDSVAFRFLDGTLAKPWLAGTEDSPASRALDVGTAAFMGGRTEEARLTGLPLFDRGAAGHRIGVSALIWRDDNLFVIHALEAGQPVSARTVFAHADFNRIAEIGMSFGGSAAPSACARIPTCRAAVNLDGESFDFSMYNRDFGKPLLVMLTGQPFSTLQLADPATNPTDYAYERWATAGTAPALVRMRVASLHHLGLTDLQLSARSPFKARLYGTINARRAVDLIDDAIQEFLDRYIKGQPIAFPSDFYRRFPEARPHDAGHVRRWWIARNAARGCPSDRIAAIYPKNDIVRMRLGDWATAFEACAS